MVHGADLLHADSDGAVSDEQRALVGPVPAVDLVATAPAQGPGGEVETIRRMWEQVERDTHGGAIGPLQPSLRNAHPCPMRCDGRREPNIDP